MDAQTERELKDSCDMVLATSEGGWAKLAKALSAFQGQVSNPPLNGRNPHFHSKYALLQDVLSTIRKPLSDNGLCVIQRPCVTLIEQKSVVQMETIVIHESGQSIRSRSQYLVEKSGPQAIASTCTYAKRIELCSILAIAGDEDDDAESAENRTPKMPARKPRKKTVKPVDSDLALLSAMEVSLLSCADDDERVKWFQLEAMTASGSKAFKDMVWKVWKKACGSDEKAQELLARAKE